MQAFFKSTFIIALLLVFSFGLFTNNAEAQSVNTDTCPWYRDLTVGSQGSDVEALQDLLAYRGFYTESSTGYFGPLTQFAVLLYQYTNNVNPAVGYFGPLTRAVACADYNSDPSSDISLSYDLVGIETRISSGGGGDEPDLGGFYFDFDLTAVGGDVYIPNKITFATSTEPGFGFEIEKSGFAVYNSREVVGVIESDSKKVKGHYVIKEGVTERFKALIEVEPRVLGSGIFRSTQTFISYAHDFDVASYKTLNIEGASSRYISIPHAGSIYPTTPTTPTTPVSITKFDVDAYTEGSNKNARVSFRLSGDADVSVMAECSSDATLKTNIGDAVVKCKSGDGAVLLTNLENTSGSDFEITAIKSSGLVKVKLSIIVFEGENSSTEKRKSIVLGEEEDNEEENNTVTPVDIVDYSCTKLNNNLQRGDKGPEVRKLNNVLFEMGYIESGRKNRNFDSTTAQGVRKFKRDYGVRQVRRDVGALVGPRTRNQLERITCVVSLNTVQKNYLSAAFFDLDLDSFSKEELVDFVDNLQEQINDISGSGSSNSVDDEEESEVEENADEDLNELDDEDQEEQEVLIGIQEQIEEIANMIKDLINNLKK